MTTMISTTWPERAAVATLVWSLTRAPARVMRSVDDSLTLAAVLPRGCRPLPKVGGELMIQWFDMSGLHERAAQVTSLKAGLLHVVPAGDARTIQRRRFFRAPVTIDLTIDDGARKVKGVTVDLSEGGTRAEVNAAVLLPQTRVTATLEVGAKRFEVPSKVVRNVTKGQTAEVGLQFGELPAAAANMIRKQVFTAQVKARRNGLGQ